MTASDARPVPRFGEPFRAYFALRYRDGDLDTDWINPSGFLSQDGEAWMNASNTPTEILSPKRGAGYIDLTSTEMASSGLVVMLENTHPSSMPLMLTFYPEQAGDYRIDPSVITDVNVVQVSGQWIGFDPYANVNVIQVSGNEVSIEDFRADSVSVNQSGIAYAVWEESIEDHQTIGGVGYALNVASGITGTSPTEIWAHSTRSLTIPVSVSGIPNVNVIQVSGEYVGLSAASIDANVVQVSGDYVSIEDFRATTVDTEPTDSGVIAQTVWEYATRALSTQDWSTFDHTVDEVIVGQMNVGTALSGIPDVNVVQVSGIPVGIAATIPSNVVQVSGEWVSIEDFRATSVEGGSADSGVIAQSVWEYATRTLTGISDVNVVQVSGDYVSIENFWSSTSGSSPSGIYDVNVVYISGIPVGIDSQSVADSDEITTVGNLLLNRARIIRLLP